MLKFLLYSSLFIEVNCFLLIRIHKVCTFLNAASKLKFLCWNKCSCYYLLSDHYIKNFICNLSTLKIKPSYKRHPYINLYSCCQQKLVVFCKLSDFQTPLYFASIVVLYPKCVFVVIGALSHLNQMAIFCLKN